MPPCPHIHVDRRDLGGARLPTVDAVIDTHAMTRADAEAVLPHLPDVHLVMLSSMDVYRTYGLILAEDDRPWPVPIDELSPVRSNRYPYGDDYDKLDVEPLYLARGGTALRLARIYGQHDPQHREEHMLRRVRAGRKKIPIGAGNTLWTSLHVDEAASGILAALDQPEKSAGEVFNLGEAQTYTMKARAQLILAAAGHEAQLVRVPDELVPADLRLTVDWSQHLLVSSDKARRILGWQPSDPVEGISRSVRWHLAHPPTDASSDFSEDDRALNAGSEPGRR
jgi:nucleoside-diphosphate-sugar epimerase